jgi:carbonic anhydrase
MVENSRIMVTKRTARVMTRLAGLITASILGGGCSLLPFGHSSPSGPKIARALRPEIHEVTSNPQPDCIAEEIAIAPAILLPAATQQPAAAAASVACNACACGADKIATSGVSPAVSPTVAVKENPAAPGEDELQQLMDGNKRFVECEPENVYHWPQRPGETNRRPPTAMVLTCSDWTILPESAFDAKAGELFVVRVAANSADDAVIESARYAVQRYDLPLIIVLGHESCDAMGARHHLLPAIEGRTAGLPLSEVDAAVKASDIQQSAALPANSAEEAIHSHVMETVAQLRRADPALSDRVASGTLKIVGAYYDETNGQITLEPEAPAGALAQTPRD